MDPAYARRIGVNIDDLLVSQPDNGEQALEIAELLIRSGALDVVAVDSVAALTPRAEIEGEMGDSHVGLQARLMSQALRKLAGTLNRTGTVALFTNQLREKIGVMFGNPETTPGGRALKFYSSVRLDIRRIETLKEGVEAIGNRVRVKVVKNKVAPPFKQAEFDIIYGDGISWEGTVLDVGLERKIVQKSGSYFSYGDERLGQGRQNATAFLREHPDVTDGIVRAIQTELGEDAIASSRLLPVSDNGAAPGGSRRRQRRRSPRPKRPPSRRRPKRSPRRRDVSGKRAPARLTALRRVGGGRVALEVDGAPWRTVPDDVVVRARLALGLELDRPVLREIRRSSAVPRRSSELGGRWRGATSPRRICGHGWSEAGRAGDRRRGADAFAAPGALDDERFAAAALRRSRSGAGATQRSWRGSKPRELRPMSPARPSPRLLRRPSGRRGSWRGRPPQKAAAPLARRGFDPETVEALLPALDGSAYAGLR